MLLSFIVPVYNVADYLCDCLNSLLNQDISINEYEIICINDGSNDQSPEILAEYAKKNNNLIVINQENQGVCTARNVGLFAARGDYIWFIDSDDLIQENCLAELKRIIDTEKPERIVIDNYLFENSPENEIMMENSSWENSVVWRSVFNRKKLIDNDLYFKYLDLSFGEDALFMYECSRLIPNSFYSNKKWYYHRKRIGSASYSVSNEQKQKILYSNLREAQIMQKYYELNDDVFPILTANRLMCFLWGTLDALARMPRKDTKSYFAMLKETKLFPYHRPKSCTMNLTYPIQSGGFVNRVYNYIYTHSHTVLGYYFLRLWYYLVSVKNKKDKNNKLKLNK